MTFINTNRGYHTDLQKPFLELILKIGGTELQEPVGNYFSLCRKGLHSIHFNPGHYKLCWFPQSQWCINQKINVISYLMLYKIL